MIANSKKVTNEQYEEALKAVGTPQAVYDFIIESKQMLEAGKQPPKTPDEISGDVFLYSMFAMVYAHSPKDYEVVRKHVDEGSDVYIYFDEDETPYVYRPMLRTEFAQAMKQFEPSSPEFEDFVVSKCVIVPKLNAIEIKTAKAGLISTLAKLIMIVSGFDANSAPIAMKV